MLKSYRYILGFLLVVNTGSVHAQGTERLRAAQAQSGIGSDGTDRQRQAQAYFHGRQARRRHQRHQVLSTPQSASRTQGQWRTDHATSLAEGNSRMAQADPRNLRPLLDLPWWEEREALTQLAPGRNMAHLTAVGAITYATGGAGPVAYAAGRGAIVAVETVSDPNFREAVREGDAAGVIV